MKYYFRCPKCGNDEQFVKPAEASGSLNGGFFGGGIYSELVFSDYAAHRVQCPKCFLLFRQPPVPRSALSRFAAWMIAFAIVPTVAAIVLVADPHAIGALPTFPALAPLEAAGAANPVIAIYLVAVLVVLITVPSGLAILISNARSRKEYAQHYRLRALRPSELAAENLAEMEAAAKAFRTNS